ncbi:MAG TPA: exopolysaccharide transport family protein [Xanthobacteraceae bacterium]|jgi:uncharacterized protein involved in exopolysaccharide biosynthesis|nr:exopolysaccharide transport family protein [Xanthobacteraceae bacterium]
MFFKSKAAKSAPGAKVAPSAKAAPAERPTQRPAHVADGELDIRALGRALWRRKRAIVLPTVVVAALAAVTVSLLTPQYKSEARILFDGRENIFLRPEAEKSNVERAAADVEALTSQVQLVLSRDVATEVIRKLNLNELPEFDPVLKGISPLKYALVMAGVSRDPLRMTPAERVLEAYFEKLTAFPLDRSRVITIEFMSSDPDLAARATNAVADGYLTLEQKVKQEQTKAAGAWLQGEIEKLRKRVAEAEAKAEEFRGKTNLFVGTNNTSLSNQQLGEFNSQLGSARAQKADAETRARLIRDMLRRGEPIETSDVANSEIIRRLSEQRVTLKGQLAEQSSTLLDGHPRIKELKAQIADLDRQITGEAEKLIRSLENDARISGARVEALSTNLDQLKRQAASANGDDVQLRALDREAKAQRELLESYLAKYREASARETIGNAPSDTRIISRAVASNTPYFPKKMPIVLVATLATMVVCAGFVCTGELMRHSGGGAPAAWPPEGSRPSAVATHPALGVPFVAIEELARNLRAAGEGGRRVAVFGASRNVGTTLSAVTLARALARDARVALIDLAVGAPNLAAISSDPQAPGVADVVRGTASFGDVITRDKLSRVHLVGAGRIGADGVAIVASQRLAMLVEGLARTYDHVIIDAGATFEAAVERLYRLAPRAVLVAADESAAPTKAARERLGAAGYGEIAVLDGAATTASAAAA